MTVRNGRGPRDPEMPSWRASDGRGNPPVASLWPPQRQRRSAASGCRASSGSCFSRASSPASCSSSSSRPFGRSSAPASSTGPGTNPWSITRFPFVADLVQRGPRRRADEPGGHATPPRPCSSVNPGDTSRRPRAAAPRRAATSPASGHSCTTRSTTGLNDHLPSGSFVLRKDMTPARGRRRAGHAARHRHDPEHHVPRGPADRADDRAAADDRHRDRPAASSTTWPRTRPRSSSPTTNGCDLPKGASLEGFLYPDTYEVVTESDGGTTQVTTPRT